MDLTCRVGLIALAVGITLNGPIVLGEETTSQPGDALRIGNAVFASQAQFIAEGRRCATPVLSQVQRTAINQRVQGFAASHIAELRDIGPITVPVLFHVIHNGSEGDVPESALDDQINVLNAAFNSHNVKFVKEGVDRTENAQWFTMDIGTIAERDAKSSLGKDTDKKLNVYTCSPPGGTLGWATFPWELATSPEIDGVVILYSSLPNGGSSPFDEGDTAVHEVGHWIGLFHTFGENPFDRCLDTDEVDDTPVHHMTFGTPAEDTDTCPNQPGKDPVHNYMSYVDDNWMDRFTDGQIQRFHAMIGLHRPMLLSSESRSRLAP